MTDKKKMFALVGNFGFKPGPKGLSIYRYNPSTAKMEWIETAFEDANVGHQSTDDEQNIVYLVNERPSLRGQTGGGGYLMAIKIDPLTGKASLINEKETLSQEPCYTCLEKSKQYILVSHHADFGFVTKIVQTEKGYSTKIYFDDTALVLFPINEDGSLGDACDVALTPGDGAPGPHTWSRHHSINEDPTGELYIVCDKGLDQFHTYHLDREKGKLVHLKDIDVDFGMAPRYGVYHPTLPYFYANYEKKPVIDVYQYDIASGHLECVGSAPLLSPDNEKPDSGIPPVVHPKTLHEVEAVRPVRVESADIVIHPSGKYIYASVRGLDTISILNVDEEGALSLRCEVNCGGVNPRGLQLSPDSRFLFSANMESGNVTVFSIDADGMLQLADAGVDATSPGNICILTTGNHEG